MKGKQRFEKFLAFLVAFLLLTLPVSVSAQLGAATPSSELQPQPDAEGQGAEYAYASGDAEPALFCGSKVECWKFLFACKEKWQCDSAIWCGIGYKYCDSSSSRIYCYNSNAVCCASSAKFCSGGCWTDCPSGQIWNCGSSGAYCTLPCTDKDGDGYGSGCSKGSDCNDNNANVNPGKSEACGNGVDDNCNGQVDEGCCPSGYPNKCGGSCWSNCGSGYRWECGSDGKGKCVLESCTNPSYPNKCGNSCWSNCGSGYTWKCKSDGTAECVQNCVDKDGDGYGSGCSKGSDCNDNNANVNPGKSEACGNGVDDNCNGQVDEGCCPSGKPYYCEKTGGCWLGRAQCEQAIACGNVWAACEKPEGNVIKCVDSTSGCCSSAAPYFCPKNDLCFPQDGFCDGRPVYSCNGKYQVCKAKSDTGKCFGDVLRCCPAGQQWWDSDKQCHKASEPQKCSVPDGSSALCDCDSDSDCPSGRPYCGEGGSLYDVRTPQGFHACLSQKPEYCGNGRCAGSENYNSCQADCASLAPKGMITVDVYYSSGANANKPVSGAYASLDGVRKGKTGKDGRISFEAAYGSRSVKVECPDNAFCGEKTKKVAGREYVRFSCNCNQPGDSDSDGYSDDDERLLGTDPNDAKENYASVFASFEHPKSCLDIPALIGIVWKNRDNLIQANEAAIAALNTTAVMAADFSVSPSAAVEALSTPQILATADIVPVDATLMEALETSEAVGGFFTDNGALLVMTDYNTSTTAIIAISATCVGWSIGGIYGAGTGVKDDVVGIWELLQGLWYAATHAAEIPKIIGDVVDFIKAIPALFGKAGEIFHGVIIGILQKGNGITQKTGLFNSDRQAYLQFQLGFVNGYVTGYVLEQIAASFIGAGTILKAVKATGLAGKAGKTLKLSKLLTEITQKYGGEVASAIQKLKYADKIAGWTEAEREALTRLAKLKHEKWLGELSEAEARTASKNIGKLADADVGNLLKTRFGQQTLKAADATDDLLAKQAKLVEKWGAKKADDVINKCVAFICYGDRISDLNKILKAMPDNLVDDFSPEKAVKFLGEKGFADILLKATAQNVVDLTKVDAESFMQYVKAVRKMGVNDPLSEIGEHQLLKIYKAPSITTKVGEQAIDDVAVLKKGNKLQDWGWEHIVDGQHDVHIKEAFNLPDADASVKKLIGEAFESGIKNPKDPFEIIYNVPGKQNSLRIILRRSGDNLGSVTTVYPDDLYIP